MLAPSLSWVHLVVAPGPRKKKFHTTSQTAFTFANPYEAKFSFSTTHPGYAAGLGANSVLPSYYPLLFLFLLSFRLTTLICRTLLLVAGIESNPGPSHPCGMCGLDVTWRGISYLCLGCELWVHRRCSNLPRASSYSPDWRCRSCLTATDSANDLSVVLDQQPNTNGVTNLDSNNNMVLSGCFLQLNCNGI